MGSSSRVRDNYNYLSYPRLRSLANLKVKHLIRFRGGATPHKLVKTYHRSHRCSEKVLTIRLIYLSYLKCMRKLLKEKLTSREMW